MQKLSFSCCPKTNVSHLWHPDTAKAQPCCISDLIVIIVFYFLMQGVSEDKQFVRESLLSRLQDDDPAVVSCVLKLGQV